MEPAQYFTPYDGGYSGYNQRSGYDARQEGFMNGPPPPPQLPYHWQAFWEAGEGRYLYVNERTGQRTFDAPSAGYGGYNAAPPPPSAEGAVYGDRSDATVPSVKEKEGSSGSHGLMYGALGAAAGLAGGAFLAHEAGEWFDGSEERDMEREIEEFPEDTAEWTGEKVGEAENIPEDVEQGFDRFGDEVESGFEDVEEDVEDAPAEVAEWAGEKEGEIEGFGDDVERFGDDMGDAYDGGRAEGRQEDAW
ncbi:hypothetical protein KC332_g11402 [Hortaea werneckii]|uniref:WW domain-containing protein n=2 Tax=Hortaea werneckii TaxID=91943 RepID=A0A3M7ILV1_HORWE|nr:hypothetical protein KC350_g10601 [Hortaea werneckii]OTA19719.1 hypothetical protein BTJ68_15475 [Hortaea werneckii EXF-2000]KAI6846407.1 hypothetical protein KC358_g2866 [Hortaea werneckii]KAI6916193.1 hypothetical protein KC348_g11668 [Hortaea werneckii]KAI6930816.1 hypothetical protein KC341_g9985 [Hortaea werneckii]